MSNRAQILAREIQASAALAATSSPVERPRNTYRWSTSRFFDSWGGRDVAMFFTGQAAAIGFRGQCLQKGAEHVGKRPTPFWNEALDKQMRSRVVAVGGMQELAEIEAAGAMPTHGRQVRVFTNPERITDQHLDAVRDLRRIEAGMRKMRASREIKLGEGEDEKTVNGALEYLILRTAFLPPRLTELMHELETREPIHKDPDGALHLVADKALVLENPLITDAYDEEMANYRGKTSKKPSLQLWFVHRLERQEALRREKIEAHDHTLDNAMKEAQRQTMTALAAYEACTEEPPEVKAERARKADEAARPRTRRRTPVTEKDVPPPFLEID